LPAKTETRCSTSLSKWTLPSSGHLPTKADKEEAVVEDPVVVGVEVEAGVQKPGLQKVAMKTFEGKEE
jgi:hypothetical protein